ncbi:hypothetical protein EVAR_67569_1 [Eumeta japonica]|uniref:Uncharacterized protein n=1 Tax=Eumeta variegata TaxID=151549 RepID=A0A4C1ZLC0_EUMVA|nr:hypothetical protein EVAR_67569_1 [Eumeta japonica]
MVDRFVTRNEYQQPTQFQGTRQSNEKNKLLFQSGRAERLKWKRNRISSGSARGVRSDLSRAASGPRSRPGGRGRARGELEVGSNPKRMVTLYPRSVVNERCFDGQRRADYV